LNLSLDNERSHSVKSSYKLTISGDLGYDSLLIAASCEMEDSL